MAFSAVMTGTARSCNITAGSNSMVVSSAAGLVVGATIQGTGIPTGSRIRSINGTTVVMEMGTGADSTATVTNATASLIFSSVYGSTLTISMSANGDTANMDTIFNAGFGVKQRGLALREIFFPGGLAVVWSNIVAGAVFDFQNWTIECGSGGYWQWEQSSIFGELRGGYLVNGTQFIKSAGPTFISNNFKNGTAGGTNMFSGTGTGTVTGTFRFNNLRVIYQVGSNSAPYFSCSRMNCIVDNMILDYQSGGGPNAGIAASFGKLNNTTIVKANSGIGNPNSGQYAIINGISYSGIFTDTPNHKFAIPNGYTLEGYAPQVLASQTLGAFQGGTTETYANIDLSTAEWGLEDLKAKYLRYGGPNTINFPRRVNFEFNDSNATSLAGVTLFIKSGTTTVVNAVQAGNYDSNTQALVLIWTTTTSAYRIRDSFTDTIAQVAQVRKYGYIEQLTSYSLNLAKYSQPFFMLTDSVLSTIDETAANAITTVELDFVNKLIKITGVATLRQAYAKCKVELAKTANSAVANFVIADGDSLNVFGAWTVLISESGVLNTSTVLKQFKVADEQVTIESGGVVNVPYQDAYGLRVTVTNLDPEDFGITWFLRHRPVSSSTWTNVSGTGNTALILLTEGVYDVQVRAPGYEWVSALAINTDISLTLSASLQYQVSANNTPQYEMSYNEVLAAAFQYDNLLDKVSVVNDTGAIIQPGFAELYRAVQRIQHLPTLVWSWEAPITANATSQKILIPANNPISMYLTDNSNATVKITCPVIHSDTGQSADDRVRGNTAGFSIILGSPATAESAGLQSAIVSDILSKLGGDGFTTAIHSLVKVIEAIDAVPLLSELEASTVLAKADSITALGAPLQASSYVEPNNTAIDEIKTKINTLQNTDISGLPSLAQIESSEVLAKATDLAAVKEKTDNLPANPAAVGDAMALTNAYDAAKNAASQDSVNLLGSPLQGVDYTAPDNDGIDLILDKVNTLNNTDISDLATQTNINNLPVAIRTELQSELSKIDAAISSRSTLTVEDIPEGITVEEIKAEIERPNGPLLIIQTRSDTAAI